MTCFFFFAQVSFSLLFLSPQKTKTKAKNSSYLARVVVGVGRVHQRDDVADRLEVRCQGLAAQQPHHAPGEHEAASQEGQFLQRTELGQLAQQLAQLVDFQGAVHRQSLRRTDWHA